MQQRCFTYQVALIKSLIIITSNIDNGCTNTAISRFNQSCFEANLVVQDCFKPR